MATIFHENAEQFISLAHIVDPDQQNSADPNSRTSLAHTMDPDSTDPNNRTMDPDSTDLNSRTLTIYNISTADEIQLDGENVGVYRGIFSALGQPRTKAEVIDGLGLEAEQVEFANTVFDALVASELVSATTGLARVLAPTWQNPVRYPKPPLSQERLETISKPYVVEPGISSHNIAAKPDFERATTRLFDPEATIEQSALERILVRSYHTDSEAKRPTPSPGGIYPVHIHVINGSERIIDDRGKPNIQPGVYQYNPLGLTLEQRKTAEAVDPSTIEYLTGDTDASDPPVWITLGVDIQAFEEKYGNASLMFQGICIGTAMQRIVEEAEHEGYGTLPLFGIQHPDVDTLLGNSQEVKTVLAIALGRPAALKDTSDRLRKNQTTTALERVSTGTNELINKIGQLDLPSKRTGMPNGFIGARAEYKQLLTDGTSIDGTSFGTATTAGEARLKATAEALERLASSNVRVDKPSISALELDAPWIDPRIVLPLDEEQQSQLELRNFQPDLAINWTAGTSLGTNEKIYAPSSLIYYPYCMEDQVIGAVSSGVAAYFDKGEAAQRGLLELIERDAIMQTWIRQQSPKQLALDAMPASAVHRMQEVTNYGKRIDVLDITQDNGVPAYMVTIRSDTFPHFYAGASAHFSPEQAIHKALDEAIVGFASRVTSEAHIRKEEATNQAQDIFTVDSHGMLYAGDPAMARTLDWLYQGPQVSLPEAKTIPSMDDLIARYNPTVFELDNVAPGNELKVVRVVAPDLVPIMFGNAGVPYRHHAFPKGTIPPKQPHFFN